MNKIGLIRWVLIGCVSFFSGVGHTEELSPQVQELIEKAEQGDANAQHDLAYMYLFGKGVLQDRKQAVKWYTKAAEQGNAKAQWDLAVMYRFTDSKQAFKWYTKVVEQGNTMAQYELAVMYRNGEGVLQDYKEAVKWFTKAAEKGHTKAQRNLALLYALGDGAPEDHVEAYAWSIHAEMNGDLKLKDMLEKELIPDQIAAGQVRTKELHKKTDRFKAQLPCSILYKGTKGVLFEHPLEDYFHAGNNRPDKLGQYFGFFKIKDSKLYLTKITKLHVNFGNRGSDMSPEWKEFPLSLIFPEAKDVVFAQWYSGRLTIPQGEVIGASPEYHLRRYEREVQIEVKNGIVGKTTIIDNTRDRDSAKSAPLTFYSTD